MRTCSPSSIHGASDFSQIVTFGFPSIVRDQPDLRDGRRVTIPEYLDTPSMLTSFRLTSSTFPMGTTCPGAVCNSRTPRRPRSSCLSTDDGFTQPPANRCSRPAIQLLRQPHRLCVHRRQLLLGEFCTRIVPLWVRPRVHARCPLLELYTPLSAPLRRDISRPLLPTVLRPQFGLGTDALQLGPRAWMRSSCSRVFPNR